MLQALRDWLPIQEGAQLSAQLPLILRGVFYDQWRPSTVPVHPRDKATFVRRIEEDMGPKPPPHLEDAITAVFELIGDRVSRGEVDDVRQSLPKDLRELWPMEPLVGDNW